MRRASHAFCAGCGCIEQVDRHWRALWVDSDGDLAITRPELDADLDFERPDTLFACGQGSALRLVNFYLHHGFLSAMNTIHAA